MNTSTWQDRLWYVAWYFVIPAVLAAALVFGLAAARVIDSPDPWQALLSFAVFEILVLGVRDRIYGSRSDGSRELRTVTAEGRALQHEAEKLMARASLAPAPKSEIDAASKAINDAVTRKDADGTAAAIRQLDELLNKTDGTMGSTKSLSPEDKRALVAYLKTL